MRLAVVTNVSEESAASIFKIEVGNDVHLCLILKATRPLLHTDILSCNIDDGLRNSLGLDSG